jgi:hypothetical protein
MKPIIKLLAAFALVLTAFSQPTGASAADVVHFRGRGVDAVFSSTDSSGCISTDVNMFAGDLLSDTSPGQASPGIIMVIFQYDQCTNTQLLAASTNAPLSKTDLKITGNLNASTLHATVSVFDEVSGTSFDVTVDLTWTGTSSVYRQNFHSNSRLGDCHSVLRSNGAFRFAEASGTVTDGTTNFTPEPSVEGHIASTNLGSVSHGCD